MTGTPPPLSPPEILEDTCDIHDFSQESLHAPTTPLLDFKGRRITLGISGSIAAYRACDLIRELYRRGAEAVYVVLSTNAQAFVSPLTLQSLSGYPVILDPLGVEPVSGTPWHIWYPQQSDVLLMYPASANMMAKCRYGFTDDLLSCTYLTFTGKPVVWVPAMNTRMWENPATQENWHILQARPQHIGLEPEAGFLACRETGKGHIPPFDHVLLALYKACHPTPKAWAGKRVIVSAGGTQEAIDVARVLTNRSSGKMGVALADEAWVQGAEVVLCAAMPQGRLPVRPYPVYYTPCVESLHQRLESLLFDEPFAKPTCLWMAAAVSDFKPLSPAIQQKLKKETLVQVEANDTLPSIHLALTLNPDVLASLAKKRKDHGIPSQQCYMVGFAAEVHEDLTLANEKRNRKGVDALVLNRVDSANTGFQSPTNAVTLIQATGEMLSSDATTQNFNAKKFPLQSKQTLAQRLLEVIAPCVSTSSHPHP